MGFITFRVKGDYICIHKNDCFHVAINGGKPKDPEKFEYHPPLDSLPFSTFDEARAYAEKQGLKVRECFHCITSAVKD